MIIKYKTAGKDSLSAEIETISVIRETDHCVFFPTAKTKRFPKGELKELKVTDWYEYHDTWNDAHQSLIYKASKRISDAHVALGKARSFFDKVNSMNQAATGTPAVNPATLERAGN